MQRFFNTLNTWVMIFFVSAFCFSATAAQAASTVGPNINTDGTLDVTGTSTLSNVILSGLKFTTGPADGFILESDTDGNASWVDLGTALGANADSDDVSEGVLNLYFTTERVDDEVSALIQNGTGINWSYDDGGNTLTPTISLTPFDTDALSEGAGNLYYTNARVDARIALASINALADVSLTGVATGDLIYFDGGNWANLADGTSGQVLTADGLGGNRVFSYRFTSSRISLLWYVANMHLEPGNDDGDSEFYCAH